MVVDGDAKCDILLVDQKSNSVHMIRNDYDRLTDTFAFTDVGIVSGGVDCQEHYGTGLFDLAVRFADIDGKLSHQLYLPFRTIQFES
jgi:hypothetical protein